MIEMHETVALLVQHFETINRLHMQGLPIVNPGLSVEAVGFQEHGGHTIGVLVTPWFMNLVLLPGSDAWSDCEQGSTIDYALPAGNYDFIVSRDEHIGTYLSAVLFRTVIDFPDQASARIIAGDVMKRITSPAPAARAFSRRELFTRARVD